MDGVSAVATTGIYCRPGCGARPRPEHVHKFPLAAAAEAAGYRACLRCRPYRSPQSVAWTNPELVCRAVRLVLDGVLDRDGEAALGARLGVSARHLRRLFADHVGVTPDGLARSARAHFARRLLDDTDLTITEVAFAAGFGSARQFNRACRDVFRASPRDLRARRRKTDRLAADGGLALRLPYHGRLDWQAMLDFFGAHGIPGVECVSGDTYRRTVIVGGHPGVLELLPGGDPRGGGSRGDDSRGGDGHLVLRAHLPHWEELIHVVARARRIASLDFDAPGVRPPGTWDPFETGVRTILGHRTTARLVREFGTPVDGLRQLGLTHTFPAPETLASADLTGYRAVGSFARAVAEDAIRLDGSVGFDHVVASITALNGVGATTARSVAFRMGEPVGSGRSVGRSGRVPSGPT